MTGNDKLKIVEYICMKKNKTTKNKPYKADKEIKMKMIAPCGMNCALCSGFLRDNKPCPGCRNMNENTPEYCKNCIIRNCPHIIESINGFCFDCKTFPCKGLKLLDKRYRGKYFMSMIENLDFIKIYGMRKFVKNEKDRWTCPECGGIFCVHKGRCLNCSRSGRRSLYTTGKGV